MAESKTKSIHCVRDLRDVPATAYRLPSDGRDWLHNSCQRQRLAMFLSTYADGDGSRVRPTRSTMAAHLSCSVRSVQRLLNDLEELGLQRRVGRHGGSRGPAVRQLDVEALRARVGVQSSDVGVPSTESSECQVGNVGVPSSVVGVPSSDVGVPRRVALDRPVLDRPPEPPPPPPTEKTKIGGGLSLQEKNLATIGKYPKQKLVELDAMITEHGYDVVDKALAAIIKDGFEPSKGEPVRNKGAVTIARLPEHIARVKQARADADARVREQAFQDASVARQNAELLADFTRHVEQHPRCEMSIEDLMADDPKP